MPHYSDGVEAQVGDLVKGKGYNVDHEIIGKVVNVRPGESCTLTVAHVGRTARVYSELGADATSPFAPVTAEVQYEFGDTKGFVKIALLMLALGLAWCGSLCAQTVPEVDTLEVLRRGDDVAVVGEGPRSGEDEALRDALAPPADDSDKWFITVITTRSCEPCERLKADFSKAPELLAFVEAPKDGKAWAHLNIYRAEDTTQHDRLKQYKIGGYPAIIVQPPINGAWGDPGTIVFQTHGYKSAKSLQADLRAALRRYAATQPKRADKLATMKAEGGAKQRNIDPPFPPESEPLPIEPFGQIPPDDSSNAGALIARLLAVLFGGSGNWAIFALILLNTGMYAWDWYRARLAEQGKTPLLSDAQKKQITEFLEGLLNRRNASP